MNTLRYKGFSILARPYRVDPSGYWTVDLEIRRSGRRQPFSAGARYETEDEALTRCSALGRQIIDGRVPGWAVDHLRSEHRSWPAVAQAFTGGLMRLRPLIIAGIALLLLGAFLLISGGTFTTRRNVLEVGDVKISANERRSVPPWVGGAVALAGVALLVAGARKRA